MPPDPLWAWPATLREQPRIQSRRTRFYPSCSGPPCASRGTRSGPRRNRWSRANNRRTLVSSCLLRVSNMAYIRFRVDRGWACCGARSTSLRYACKRATRFDQLQWIISMIVIIHGACIVMYPPKKLYMILRPVELNGHSIGSTRWGTMYTCVYYVYFLIRNNLGLKISKIFE